MATRMEVASTAGLDSRTRAREDEVARAGHLLQMSPAKSIVARIRDRAKVRKEGSKRKSS